MARRKNHNRKRARQNNRTSLLHIKDGKLSKYKKFVTNLSTCKLTNSQYIALAKGIKFIPTPKPQLNKREIIQDFKEMTRKMTCKFLFGNKDDNKQLHPFRINSGYKPPPCCNAIEAYTNHTLDELIKLPQNKKRKPNISKNELTALKELRNNNDIVIKKADKCSTIVIMDRTDYVKETERQLQGIHYRPSPPPDMNIIHQKIMSLINEMYRKGEIDKETYNFLLQTKNNKDAAHLYLLPKTHKLTPEDLKDAEINGLNGKRVPGRPIVSQVATPTYYIGHLVDYFLLPFVTKLPTYLKDTPAFITLLEETTFPADIKIVTYDVSNMYTVLDQNGLLNATKEALPTTLHIPPLPEISRERIINLLDIMLKNNIFTFDGKYYQQIIGCAMGQVPSPSCSDLLTAKIMDDIIHNYQHKTKLVLHKRYRDDGIIFTTSTYYEIDELFRLANGHTEGITLTHTTSEQESTFLDITLYKGERFETTRTLDLKLHRKPTDTFQYLHRHSAHPEAVFSGLVKGETLRIIRNCSDINIRNKEINFYHDKLVARGYDRSHLEQISSTVLATPRSEHLKPKGNKGKKKTKCPPLVMVTKFNPSSKGLKRAITKHWNFIKNDEQCNRLFKNPPMIAYKRHKNLTDITISSKLKPKQTDPSSSN